MSTMSNISRLFVVATAMLVTAGCAADPMPETDEPVPDIENGKATFQTMCGVCHSVQDSGGPIEGPNLIGVVGRAAASHPDFNTKYSPALKASRLTWNENTLDTFLVNPMAMVPGTFMPMMIKDDQTRADVIAYLASLKKQAEDEE